MAKPTIQKRDARGQIVSVHKDIPNGTVFGRLSVLGNERCSGKNYVVDCQCDCGAIISVRVGELKRGKKKQCGAHSTRLSQSQREAISRRNQTHGRSRTVEYNAWLGMKARCCNPTNKSFPNYGGRGIRVHAGWLDNFEAFLAYIGPRPRGFSLDRIDVDGDYEPTNVRWSDSSTQMKNRRPFIMASGTREPSTPLKPAPDYIPPNLPPARHGNFKHGMGRTPEYEAWRSMLKRCLNPKHNAYHNYGGRGITVCEAWRKDFLSFLTAVGMRPDSTYSLERVDNHKGYEAGNVLWADASAQNRNRRPFVMRSGKA